MKILKVFSFLALVAFFSFSASAQNLGTNIGDKARELEYFTPNAVPLKLSSLKGKMVLIDFWASWCPPCRRENPNVVKVYNTYKDKEFEGGSGFVVFSVSLDQKMSAWTYAIKLDELDWDTHVSDLKGWNSEAAKIYGVKEIPMSFLIDGEGIIIAKNLRGASLEQTLESLLKK